MTDMHAACASDDQARREFEWLCQRFALLMNDVIARAEQREHRYRDRRDP